MPQLNAVTVYTTGPDCMACVQTKRHLGRKGIPYTEVLIDSDPALLPAIQFLGYSTAPVVCVSTTEGETHWSGYRPDHLDALTRLDRPAPPTNGAHVAHG